MEKVVLSKEQTEKFVRLLTEKPPQYWTIKQFQTYVNGKLKEPFDGEKTIGDELGIKKYTQKMLFDDLSKLEIVSLLRSEGTEYVNPGRLWYVFMHSHNSEKIQWSFFSDCAEGLFRLILRLRRGWDFYCFLRGDKFYFCDLFEHSTALNPSGKPAIAKYKIKSSEDDYKHTT